MSYEENYHIIHDPAPDKNGYVVILRLHRNDIAAYLASTGLDEAQADELAATVTNDELELMADRISDNEAFMDTFWMTLGHAIETEKPEIAN